MFVRVKKSKQYRYLQICESRWEDGRSRQRVVATLGRVEDLADGEEIAKLTAALGKYSQKALVLTDHQRGESAVVATRRIGPTLVFERLWKETGCREVVERLAAGRAFQFSIERAVFLTVLHRLFSSGSDRAAERWREDYAIEGAEELQLHHLYRAMAWLGEELPKSRQKDGTGISPLCTKDLVEEALFLRGRDLFSERDLDLVFFDTTTLYFEGRGGETLGARGHSKDRRPDHKQIVVGVVLDNAGNPLCCEIWPGNTTDVKTLVPIVDRFRRRFGIGSVCVVADRGMISKKTIAELEKRGWSYILGARMRKQKDVRDKVLARPGRYKVVREPSSDPKALAPLKVKDVKLTVTVKNQDGTETEEEHRYVVCLNEDEAKADAEERSAILESLAGKLKQGAKRFIGNRGYRKFLRVDGGRMVLDEAAIKREARYDGKWVLRTNTDLPAAEVALKYKQLLDVETVNRTLKSTLETRPIYHQVDATIRGHVFCSFLALLLRKELMDRLAAKGHKLEWSDILRDLDRMTETQVEKDGKHFVLRDEVRGGAGWVFQAAGVALPPTVRQVSTEEAA